MLARRCARGGDEELSILMMKRITMSTEVIGNGRTADVIKYDETSVLKLFKPFMKNDFVAQEFQVAFFAFKNNLNTPKPIKIVNEKNRTGIVYNRIIGKSLLQVLSENPLQMSKIACRMAQFHFEINQVKFDDINNLQKKNIKNAIQSVSCLDENDKAKIIEYLFALPDKNNLCHGDFHPDNIMVNEKYWIIDWMTGSSGNPLCDIARSKLVLETSEIPNSVSILMRIILKLGQKKLARLYVKEYCRIGNIKTKDINIWLLPLYAARLVENLSEKETIVIMKKIRKEMKKKLTTAST